VYNHPDILYNEEIGRGVTSPHAH